MVPSQPGHQYLHPGSHWNDGVTYHQVIFLFAVEEDHAWTAERPLQTAVLPTSSPSALPEASSSSALRAKARNEDAGCGVGLSLLVAFLPALGTGSQDSAGLLLGDLGSTSFSPKDCRAPLGCPVGVTLMHSMLLVLYQV